MADNLELNSGSGGATLATDDIGGVHHQKVKVEFGGDDSATQVTSGTPLPITGTVTANAGTGTMTVDGSGVTQPVSAASLPLPSGAATAAAQLPDGHNVTIDNAAGTNPVPTAPDDLISTNNSTTSLLGIDANFTGTGDDCSGYSSVTITLFADQNGATDGMKFQFSTDNTNWDDTYSFTMTASETRRFQFPVTARYFRLNYTNGGTGQGAFRVQTILHRTNVLTSIHRLVDDTDPDRSAQVVKAAIIAQAAGAGDFVPVQSTAGGNLKFSLEEVDAGVTVPVDGSGVTQPVSGSVTVSGTVTANAGTGTFTVDGSGVTQPISAAALPLPSGAATAANQLPDGHNVTIDNGAAGAAVNIQDGGNTITVDNGGTFAVQSTLQTGSNTIGKLAANSGVDIGDVDVTSQPARAAGTDNISAADQTDAIYNGTTSITPKFATIDEASSGDNQVVAAVAGKKIRVLSYVIVSSAANTCTWRDGTSPISGGMSLAANGGVSAPYNPLGHFETTANTTLNLNLSAAQSVDGHLTYIEV
jgi:hypothetical protein